MEHSQITETELWTYISKTADTITVQKVEQWMNSVDFDKELFSKIITIYNATEDNTSISSVNTAKKHFFDKVLVEKPSPWKKVFKYAAIIAVLVTGIYTYQQSYANSNQIIVQTTFGEHKKVNLADGSIVLLNSSSKLSYNSDTPRTLFLEGEAFFEVAKDINHPFTVRTSDRLKVRALGTSFNVKSYLKGATTETKLLTGKVEVTSSKHFTDTVLMVPNDKVSFFRNNKKIVKSKMALTENSIAWRESKIQFTNKPFKEIANDLNIQFNIKINFENKEIQNSKFTGSFDNKTPVNEILEILKMSKDFDFEQTKENEWIIK